MISIFALLLAVVPAQEEALPGGTILIQVARPSPFVSFAIGLSNQARILGSAPSEQLETALDKAIRELQEPRPGNTLDRARDQAQRILGTDPKPKTKVVAAFSGIVELSSAIKTRVGHLSEGTVSQAKTTGARQRGKRVVVIDDDRENLVLIARPLSPPSEEKLPALLAAAASFDVFGSRLEIVSTHGFVSLVLRSETAIAKTAKSALGVLDKTRHGPSIEAIALGRRRAATRAAARLSDPSTQVETLVSARIQGRSPASVDALVEKILAATDTEVASAARLLTSGDDVAIIVVASATQELVKELAGIPGVRDVSVVSAAER
jgi:predicted Zn-dependent peptidase